MSRHVGSIIALAAVWLSLASAAQAANLAEGAAPDCPLGRSSYSLDTPLYDLLLDPRARAALDEAGLLAKLPASFTRPGTPSFATIISLRTIDRWKLVPPKNVARLQAQLEQLPIRPQDVAARCARYESSTDRILSVDRNTPAVLVFEKSNGFRDGPSVEAATAALRDIGARRGWQMVFSGHAADFTPANLKQFDAVVWNNVSGDALTLDQREAFEAYIEGGGGFAGFHGSGGDPVYWWDWYADLLIGARFIGHPEKHQSGRLTVEGTDPITRGITGDWSLLEEWYSFAQSPRRAGARVLVALDEQSYDPEDGPQKLRMGSDHPVAWARCVGDGRSFYSAIGHRPEVYADPRNLLLMEQGIEWAMGRSGDRCGDGQFLPRSQP